ncbi:histone H2A-like [Carcharodon carcharias]|uniref:histone H2A-like n=1 Tax=Carcharodon carcharias TaxID=13397 RepID=UPI001B7EBC21|nr:histone H2A-like [Carcharodon carcharias]
MSGPGKTGGKGYAKAKTRSSKPVSSSPLAVSTKGHYAERVGGGTPVYLATALEYLTAEILELAGNTARDNKRTHHSRWLKRSPEDPRRQPKLMTPCCKGAKVKGQSAENVLVVVLECAYEPWGTESQTTKLKHCEVCRH